MFRLIAILLLVGGLATQQLSAQEIKCADNRSYAVNIDIHTAYISGVCFVTSQADVTTVGIVNEFGVSALTCRYNAGKQRVKILNILKPLAKPHIKSVLRKDFAKIIPSLLQSDADQPVEHTNKKYGITYRFVPMATN